ncbi:MAG: hypothetical protein M3063_04190, partial [Actinomycetota bacterium]|nr:hypothetical protein [Actinomycetota bacterium]
MVFSSLALAVSQQPALADTNYAVTSSTGAAIVPGTTDVGNHCDDCTTAITLPFGFQLYDRVFTTANVSSNGSLQFGSANPDFILPCLPSSGFSYTLFPYGADLRTDFLPAPFPLGIFTTVTGSAPNRVFNIEWRA